MSPAASRTVTAYARALERYLEKLHGPPFVLSPRDWSLAEEWHARGVPVAAVIECLTAAAQRRSRRGGARGAAPRLSDVIRQVNEAWSVVRSGRLPRISAAPRAVRGEQERDMWTRAKERAGAGSALGMLLTTLLARLDEGATAEEVDELLDAQLPRVAAREFVEESSRAVDRELDAFHDRWSEAELRDARRERLCTHLRRRFALPRISRRPAERVKRTERTE